MSPRFIKRLPLLGRESFLNVQVRKVGPLEAHNWKKLVQPHVIKSRVDFKWNWPWLYQRSVASERMLNRNVSLYSIEVPASNEKAAPLALMMLSEGYPALDDGHTPSVYVWYVAVAPGAALAALGTPPEKFAMILESLLDIAIQRSYELGYDGRVGLHAHKSGQEELFSKYRDKARMTALSESASLTFARNLMGGNDGRYFWTDPKLAKSLSNSLDYLR